MKFVEALETMMEGEYVARECWHADAQYCVIMPGMAFIWLIKTVPTPNAGVWMGSVADLLADDWKVVDSVEVPVQEAGQEAAA